MSSAEKKALPPTAVQSDVARVYLANRQKKQDSTSYRCQKCLQFGHYTYECTGKRKYAYRPSRSKQLTKKEKLDLELKNKRPAKKINSKEKKRSHKRRVSTSTEESSSDSSSEESSGSGSSSSGEETGSSSSDSSDS
ncbi:zinc finger CCHC domain-containing protein 10-like [Halichondria panicea]|uniref:zinc finger CCHC domain-containing protein 10-like n=1 Tax=Halichondria panicea TaxID=6063 RepID=UPI00312B4471